MAFLILVEIKLIPSYPAQTSPLQMEQRKMDGQTWGLIKAAQHTPLSHYVH